jgi:protein-L-isoaspartate(D-aspartate) O-methyltransferase
MKTISLILFSLYLILGCKDMKKEKMQDSQDRFAEIRSAMVQNQIKARGVRDNRVLEAMREVPRHLFVPDKYQGDAYRDEPLPIGSGQTISQPYIVAYMTEQLDLEGDERVLEIGTGSGYQAAILAELSDSVFTIEIIPELSEKARQVVESLGYRNVQFKVGDGYQGWPEKAPFDAVIVTAAPDHVPQPLLDQMGTDGRMMIPVGDFFQELYLIRKTKRGFKKERKLPVRFVPMTGESDKHD